jgi:predicted nucleotidyltransferase component of viral defense system
MNEAYRDQLRLLVKLLPALSEEADFALKGGTAINLFERNLPRLSVDIDLTYLPFDERNVAHEKIAQGLDRIKARIEADLPDCRVTLAKKGVDLAFKLQVQRLRTAVKIEVNPTLRGHLLPKRRMTAADKVQDEFESFASINVVSFAELFGGKICAALDRQHPRDLFDVKLLLDEEGLTPEVRQGVMAGLLSHPRPFDELLRPVAKDQAKTFATQFDGMALISFSYEDHQATLARLTRDLHAGLTADNRRLMMGFMDGAPDWQLFPLPDLERLPAVQWKLENIRKLKAANPAKHRAALAALAEALQE